MGVTPMVLIKKELIPKTFYKNRYNYKLIDSFDINGFTYAVYGQLNKLGVVICHEIHKLRLYTKPYPKFKILVGQIRLANNEEFGKWAWSVNDLDRVKAILNEFKVPSADTSLEETHEV